MSVPLSGSSFDFEVAAGRVAGHSMFERFGHVTNLDVADGIRTLWAGPGSRVPLLSAETMDLVSTSSQDTNLTGTGAWNVAVCGLDAAGVFVVEVKEMDGVNVVTTTQTFRHVTQLLSVYPGGTLRENQGIITATATTAATLQEHMEPFLGRASTAGFAMPTGQAMVVENVEFSLLKAGGGQDAVVTIRAALQDALDLADPRITFFTRGMNSGVDGNINIEELTGVKVAAQKELVITAQTDKDNTEFRLRLIGKQFDD